MLSRSALQLKMFILWKLIFISCWMIFIWICINREQPWHHWSICRRFYRAECNIFPVLKRQYVLCYLSSVYKISLYSIIGSICYKFYGMYYSFTSTSKIIYPKVWGCESNKVSCVLNWWFIVYRGVDVTVIAIDWFICCLKGTNFLKHKQYEILILTWLQFILPS